MAITYRADVGRPLTNAEVDANFAQLANGSIEGFLQSGGTARSWISKARETVSVTDFGVVGDGTTNDDAEFTLLEAEHTGKPVDLLGLVCLVTAIPTGNDYHNGAFKVGSEIYWRHRNPRLTPFHCPAPSVKYVDPAPRIFRGFGAMFPIGTNGLSLYVWREAKGHGNEDVGTRLVCARSDDFASTFIFSDESNSGELPTLVYTDSTADTRNMAAGPMGSGRLGIMAARVKADDTQFDPIFIYSDDSGLTWTAAAVTAPTSATTNFHSRIYPYPEAAGGHDTTGFICYFYHSGGISALTTVDNGANWTEVADILEPTVTFASISEMSVARLGSQNKWVMVVRTSAGQNAAISTSANMTTWSAIADSGLKMSSNPPELFYEDGRLWLVSFSRRNRPIITEYENALVIASVDGDAVYAAAGVGVWSGWRIVSALPFHPTGYISIEKIRDRYYGFFTGEDYAASTQSRTGYLMLLSSDVPAVASYPAISKMRGNPNLCVNGGFRSAQRGDTIAAAVARATVFDGFTFARASSGVGWTLARVTGDRSTYALRVQRDDAETGTESMVLALVLTSADSIPLREQQVTLSFRARKGDGFSAANSFLTTTLRTSADAEQVVSGATGTMTGDTTVGSSSTGVTLTTDWKSFKLTPSKLAATANQLMCKWVYTPVGTATDDYYEIEQVKLEIGAVATPFEFEPFHVEKHRCERFIQVFTVQSINGTIWIPFSPRMHRAPTVTLSAGTGGNITTSGFELTHNASALITVTADGFL
jgi:hypothetical protein